eukprot:CAMPEP_0117688108 /NCGR_PEP_ID=MMETSP0804-20121206/23604_1 /TAXON_ID=1074897 /ORGANISM="Tetraselmis astigmatica, Strain CCMP880" /LENGTH=65 /DNA_ID=CAMNT_0005500439 /DNA_START=259 /DNA_END=456 /DNA_ORIENTATION=-
MELLRLSNPIAGLLLLCTQGDNLQGKVEEFVAANSLTVDVQKLVNSIAKLIEHREAAAARDRSEL